MREEEEKIDTARRTALVAMAGAALAALLAACGKKGDLDPPPEAKDRKPRTYPKPQ
ncbi:MAG: lipoprotein [Reyranellaceae bacterium]